MIARTGERGFFRSLRSDSLDEKIQDRRIVLAEVYVSDLVAKMGQSTSDPTTFANNQEKANMLETLRKSGLVENAGDGAFHLTEAGRKEIKVVMAGGSFDIIHPGHIETLEKAKSLGDVLIVSVARDSTYLRNKKKKPLHDERQRRKMVNSVKFVDAAVLGSEVDIFKTVEVVRPDIVALGYDQSHDEAGFKAELLKRGLTVEVVRLDSSIPEVKTSRIAQDYY